MTVGKKRVLLLKSCFLVVNGLYTRTLYSFMPCSQTSRISIRSGCRRPSRKPYLYEIHQNCDFW